MDVDARPSAAGGVGEPDSTRDGRARPLALLLAAGCGAAVLALVVVAALTPAPDRLARGLLVVVAVVLLLGVAAGWVLTVRRLANSPR